MLNFASEGGQLELFLAVQENPRLESTFSEQENALLIEENGGIRRALVTSVSQGHLPLTRAILQSTSFRSVPREGPNSLNTAFDLAFQKKNTPILEAFLRSNRGDEIYEHLRMLGSNLIGYEAAAPKNCLARFFLRLTLAPIYQAWEI
jgi:hypothetical protein